MTNLVVSLTDKVGVSHIKELIEKNEWDNVYLITDRKMSEAFDAVGDINMVIINPMDSTEKIIDTIYLALKNNISSMEVGLNLFSGKGKEHMAIISALLKMGIGIRLVMQGQNGIKEL